MSGNTVPVLVARSGSDTDTKSLLARGAETVQRAIDVETLRRGLADLTMQLQQILNGIDEAAGQLSLDTIQVGVEITAEGGVVLIGTAKASATASVTLTFSKKK